MIISSIFSIGLLLVCVLLVVMHFRDIKNSNSRNA